jgi:THAP4-like, heme-binding beta-barrel domain
VELTTDLPAPLVPLAWLIGRWEGAGVVGYPTIESANFGQEIEFRHDGRPFLHYRREGRTRDDKRAQREPPPRPVLLDDEGAKVRPLATEVGFWRPGDDGEVEVLLTHPTGYVEIYVGTVEGPRVTLRTDLVARTPTAKEYTAATRMYGLVDSDLMWVMDMAAVGQPMQSHASAQLKRVE